MPDNRAGVAYTSGMADPHQQRLTKARRALLFIALALALVLFGFDRYAAFAHVPGKDSTRVAIYTTTWCPYCKRLREDLQRSGIPYVEYDVEKSFQGELGYWALRGRGVPISAIGPTVVDGYRIDRIQSAMKELGYEYVTHYPRLPSSESVSTLR